MRIALGWSGPHLAAQHRILTGRDDDTSARGMVLNGGRDRSVVKDAVPNEPIDTVFDLGQQRRDLGRVLLMACRHRGGDNAALCMHPNMQFLPAPGLLLAVFLAMPCTLAADLSPRTVDDHVEQSRGGMIDLLPDGHRRMAPGQRGVIGVGKRHVHQAQNRAKTTFRLAQRQAKEQPERKRRLDGDGGVYGARPCASPLAIGVSHGKA